MTYKPFQKKETASGTLDYVSRLLAAESFVMAYIDDKGCTNYFWKGDAWERHKAATLLSTLTQALISKICEFDLEIPADDTAS